MNLKLDHPGRKAIEEMLFTASTEKIPAFKFLVRHKFLLYSINPKEEIVLKKSLAFRIYYFASGVFLIICGIIILIKQYRYFIVGIISIIAGIWMAVKIFDTRKVITVSANGLLIDEAIFITWTDIEYLYFERKDDDDNYMYCLIICLKNGSKHQIDLTGLGMSEEKLGEILYAYMKKYNN